MNPEKYVDAEYHFQKSARQSESIIKMFKYIRSHDDYIYMVIDNVESMPRRTKKQKNEYEKIKEKELAFAKAIEIQIVRAVEMANSSIVAV